MTADERLATMEGLIRELEQLMREVHQRQSESVIPDLQTIKKELYGNGVPGLVKEHIACQEKIREIDGLKQWVRASMLTVVLAAVTFAFGYGRLHEQIQELARR